MLNRILALVEVAFSNSMIETCWRSLSHQWLYLHMLDSLGSVKRLIAVWWIDTYDHATFSIPAVRHPTRSTLAPEITFPPNSRLATGRPRKNVSRRTTQDGAGCVTPWVLPQWTHCRTQQRWDSNDCCTCTRPALGCPRRELRLPRVPGHLFGAVHGGALPEHRRLLLRSCPLLAAYRGTFPHLAPSVCE